MTLQEMIVAAQKRVNESEGEAKVKAEAELAALKSVESAGYTKTQADVNTHAGTSRSEGKSQGEKEARKALLDSLGIPDDENADAELARIKERRDGEKSDAERFKSQAETLQAEKEAEAKRASEFEATLRERDRRDAILSALTKSGYQGKTAHALGAIDASFSGKVKEEDGTFDASEAVKALKEDEFPGFVADLNPPPDSQRTRTRGSQSSSKKSPYTPNYSVTGNRK